MTMINISKMAASTKMIGNKIDVDDDDDVLAGGLVNSISQSCPL